MIRSMTGYGRDQQLLHGRSITVEIRSVNHRYFEFSCRSPRGCAFLEDRLKRALQSAVSRGKVEVSLTLQTVESRNTSVAVDHALAGQYINALRALGEEYALPDDLTLSAVCRLPDFKAHFKPGVNIVRHTYTYKESYGVGHTFWIDYKLTPATRWANRQIDDFTLRINAKGISKHFMVDASPFMGASENLKIDGGTGRARMVNWSYEDAPTEAYNYYELSLRNATAEWHATNFRPQSELYISSADNMIMMAQYGTKINVSEGGAFAESVYYDGGVNYSPLPLLPRTKSKSLNRRICRNLPFAARGYKFKDLKLKKFFESQWWYIADPAYNPAKDKTLNALDKNLTKGYFNKNL